MGSAKRKPATMRAKQEEVPNKKAIYITAGVAGAVIVILSVLIIIFS